MGMSPEWGWNSNGMASLVEFTGNCGRFGLGYKPTRTNMRRSALERRWRSMGRPQWLQVKGVPLCHINKSFVSAGWMCEGWVTMIHEETQIGCGRALLSSSWGTGKLSSNLEFSWQAQCYLLVLTLLLGLGFRVVSLFGHVFCYHKIINIQSFFCIFILLQLNDTDPTMSPVKVIISRTHTWILSNW